MGVVGEELGATRESQGAVGEPRGDPVEEMGEVCQGLVVPRGLDSVPHWGEEPGAMGEATGDPVEEMLMGE